MGLLVALIRTVLGATIPWLLCLTFALPWMERQEVAGMPWATRIWPGLPQIWSRGSWSGLIQAVGFAVAVNLAVLGSFWWVELLPSGLLTFVWLAIGLVWIGSALFSEGRLYPNSELGHVQLEGIELEDRAAGSVRRKEKLDWPEWTGRVNTVIAELERLVATESD